MEKYRVAFIGCGNRAKAHAAAIREDSRCEVVALSDLYAEAAQAFNEQFGFGAALFTDYEVMLAEVKPDIVISCLWTPLHLQMFRACAAAGVRAVHSEKPMAPAWGDCLEMARIAEATGSQLTFCHQRRFASGNRLVRQWVEKGRIGQLLRMDLYSPPNLLDCGTHTFDQALSFNGEFGAKWVLGAVDGTNPLNWFDVSAESMAVGTLVFENAVRANVQTGGPDQDMHTGVRLIGSKGFIEVNWDGEIGEAVIYDDPSWKPEMPASSEREQMAGVVEDIVGSLAAGREPELSYRKALRASEIIYAFYESVRRHARIELPLAGMNDNPFIQLLEAGHFAPAAGQGA
ncbi:Gfo/Idh/MocA family protein [Paenibacillus sacheonensis]|uniref:Gfo/Idh/MocA family oxidoreductase n=1 Tax=Paenibacillus sacheonensis TaxID=742054 RepID=A0A7X4YXP9_9BACL|nr:Gfo/Idh/MocA family oxidoreductase [Paenibacillus sacheonensis]MBM7566635.1 putative dehydrogenase [Paenibacillus sacheonensis]NBC73551.1 Gfo/Idh/MocA family oxidoreductase [Paenibacillus sacheonensis]